MSLMDDIAGVMKDANVEVDNNTYVPVPSGIDVMDAFNARYFYKNELKTHVFHCGVPMSKQILLTGYTGTGKSTLGIQVGMAIVAPYEQGGLFHFDQEKAYSVDRVVEVTGLPYEQVKAQYRNMQPAANDEIYSFILKVWKLKTTNRAKYEVTLEDGSKILAPTVIMVDTVVALTTSSIDEKAFEKGELGSVLAEPGSIAKTNNMIYQRCPRYLADANITLISINHIRDKVSDSQTREKKRVFQMGANETVPGGHGHQQMADYWIKMVGDEQLKETERYKIPGKIIECRMIKSRLAREGATFYLVYNPKCGFDNILTNLHYLVTTKELKGAGAHLYFETDDGTASRKFNLGEFKSVYLSDAAFRELVDTKMNEVLGRIVPEPDEDIAHADSSSEEMGGASLMDEILAPETGTGTAPAPAAKAPAKAAPKRKK